MKLKILLFSLLPTIIIMSGAEVVARIFSDEINMGYESLWMDVMFEKDNFIKVKKIDGTKYFYAEAYPAQQYTDEVFPEKSLDGKYITVNKKEETTRIFSYGGSSTAGSPFGHWASFTRFLSYQLNSLKRSDENLVETINFGSSGGSISRAEFLLRKTIHLNPDVVIIYSGHNEICDAGSIVYHLERVSKLQRANEHLYVNSYFYRYLTSWFKNLKPAPPFPKNTFSQHQCHRPQVSADFGLMDQRYSNAVNEIIKLSKRHGVKVIFVSQVANELLMPSDILLKERVLPKDEYWQTERRVFVTEPGNIVLSSYVENDDKKTLDLAGKLLSNDKNNPIAFYVIGLIHLKNNNLIEAKKYLAQALDFDRQPTRYRSSFTDIIKKNTQNNANAYFVDIGKNISELVSDEIIDGRLIIDVMHPNIELQKYISNEIIKQYFIKNKYEKNLFDYSKFDNMNIFDLNISYKKYGLFCRKFYIKKEWKLCVDEALAEFDKARPAFDFYKKRSAMRVWENAYYYGQTFKDDSKLVESRRIFTSLSNRE